MKNSVTTNYRRNSDNSSEQIQRIVIWTEIMIQSIMNLIFCEIFEQRIVLLERQAYLCTSSEQKDDSKKQ